MILTAPVFLLWRGWLQSTTSANVLQISARPTVSLSVTYSDIWVSTARSMHSTEHQTACSTAFHAGFSLEPICILSGLSAVLRTRHWNQLARARRAAAPDDVPRAARGRARPNLASAWGVCDAAQLPYQDPAFLHLHRIRIHKPRSISELRGSTWVTASSKLLNLSLLPSLQARAAFRSPQAIPMVPCQGSS